MAPRRCMPALYERWSAPIHSSRSGFTGFFTSTGTSLPASCRASAISCMAKGFCRGAGAYPQYVDSGGERVLYMLTCGHLGSRQHSSLFLHLGEPREAFAAHSLETTGLGARFPYAGAEYLHSVADKFACCRKHLFFSLGAAWAGDNNGGACPFFFRQNRL